MAGKSMRGEVEVLTEQVRLLQAQVAALQVSVHHCHGCSCAQPAGVSPYWQPRPYEPFRVTCGTSVSIVAGAGASQVTGPAALAAWEN